MKKFLAAFILLTLISTSAMATEKYIIDPKHTNITWIISHMGYSNTIGMFSGTTGTILFDRSNPANSNVDISIDINGLQTIVPALTEHLKGADFFDVEHFPDAKFTSTKIENVGKSHAVVRGNLTLLGKTRPVKLVVTFNKSEANPMSHKRVAGFSAEANIKRSDFGMKSGLPMIGDDVKLLIEVEATDQADIFLE